MASGISAKEESLLKLKHQRALDLRNEFIKQMTNPHRCAEGGHFVVTALLRFQALNVYHVEHFKPTGKSLRAGLLILFLPIALTAYAFKTSRDGKEKLFRTGQIAYKDRKTKFV